MPQSIDGPTRLKLVDNSRHRRFDKNFEMLVRLSPGVGKNIFLAVRDLHDLGEITDPPVTSMHCVNVMFSLNFRII